MRRRPRKGVEAIHAATKHFDADPDYVPGTGAFIGTNLETGSYAAQCADARRAYEKEIDATAISPELENQNVRDVWQDAQHHWRAIAVKEKAAASGLTATAAVIARGVTLRLAMDGRPLNRAASSLSAGPTAHR